MSYTIYSLESYKLPQSLSAMIILDHGYCSTPFCSICTVNHFPIPRRKTQHTSKLFIINKKWCHCEKVRRRNLHPSGKIVAHLENSPDERLKRSNCDLPHKSILCIVIDRKSTRLNSSHVVISYAVFCLKKKNKRKN